MDKDKICLELINYCRSNQRVAPKLNKWALLLELIDPARSNESLSIPYYDWEQVGALVHWLVLEAQIKHAYENGLIDEVTKFLIELKEDDWDHIDDGGIRSDEVKQPSGGRLTVLIIDIHRYRILTTTWDGGYLNDQFNDLIRSEFDPREEEKQLRVRLAEMLRYVVSQRLAPRRDGGRALLMEIMGYALPSRRTA